MVTDLEGAIGGLYRERWGSPKSIRLILSVRRLDGSLFLTTLDLEAGRLYELSGMTLMFFRDILSEDEP